MAHSFTCDDAHRAQVKFSPGLPASGSAYGTVWFPLTPLRHHSAGHDELAWASTQIV